MPIVLSVLIVASCSRPRAPTTSATSPDGRFRVELHELKRSIDRNFEVVLVDEQTTPPTSRIIFTSPDEGAPPGTERFVWSNDSRAVLLVGKRFTTVDEAATSSTHERLYLLYDAVVERIWCNASQVSDMERIDSAQLAQYGLAGWEGSD